MKIGCKNAILVAALVLLGACSDDDENPYESMSPEQIYNEASLQAQGADYLESAETFEEIERLFPYSEWARRGTIMAAYNYGRAEEFEKSRSAGERFLSSYPGDENAAYAQYLVAMSYYEQLDDLGRDQKNTTNAIRELRAVTKEYPNSAYAKSSELKLDLAFNHLAAKEMEIGRYYLKRGNFAAAIKRFQFVLNTYGTTAQVPEALHRLVESYLSLGLVEQARETAVVLGYNFQGSEWYADTHNLFVSRGLPEPSFGDTAQDTLQQFYRHTLKGEWL